MFIERELSNSIDRYIQLNQEHNDVLLLFGARQVGKSTLVTHYLKNSNAVIVNLYEMTTLSKMADETETFEEFEGLLRRELNFVPSQGRVLVIDEAQESKKIGRWLRFFKEKWARQKVIVMGSILSNLFDEDVSYPVGRVIELVLRPFSFREYLRATGREGLLDTLKESNLDNPLSEAARKSFIKPYLNYLQNGGMPQVVIGAHERNELPRFGLDRILRQYAVDVERHLGEAYKTMFLSAIDRIADITCHPVKNSQIISTSSPSYRKLPALMEVMEKWHLVHRVAAETKHPESASGIASKRYLFDTGMVNFLINHAMPVEWSERSDKGNLVYPKLQEDFVCNEIVAAHAEPISFFNYYKETRASSEIDFLVPVGNSVVPVEVKSGSSISKNSLIPMLSFLNQRGLQTGVLIYNGEMRLMKIGGKSIFAIPPFYMREFIERF